MDIRRVESHTADHRYDLRNIDVSKCLLTPLSDNRHLLLFKSEQSEISLYLNNRQARALYASALGWAQTPLKGLHLFVNGGVTVYADAMEVTASQIGEHIYIGVHEQMDAAKPDRSIRLAMKPDQVRTLIDELTENIMSETGRRLSLASL